MLRSFWRLWRYVSRARGAGGAWTGKTHENILSAYFDFLKIVVDEHFLYRLILSHKAVTASLASQGGWGSQIRVLGTQWSNAVSCSAQEPRNKEDETSAFLGLLTATKFCGMWFSMDVLPGKYKLTEDSRSSMFKDVSLNDVFFFFGFRYLYNVVFLDRLMVGFVYVPAWYANISYFIIICIYYLQYILYTASMRIWLCMPISTPVCHYSCLLYSLILYISYILWFMCVFVSTWWFAVATTCYHDAIRADHAQHESIKVIQTKVLETHVSALRLFLCDSGPHSGAIRNMCCIVKCHSVLRSTSALGSSLPVCFLGDDGLVHVRTSASRKARSYVFKCVEYWHALAGPQFSYCW